MGVDSASRHLKPKVSIVRELDKAKENRTVKIDTRKLRKPTILGTEKQILHTRKGDLPERIN